ISSNWQTFEDKEASFNEWITKLDTELCEIEESICVTLPSSFVLDLIKRLDNVETEINQQEVNTTSLIDEGKHLLTKMAKGSRGEIEIKIIIEKLTQKWQSMRQRMEKSKEALTVLSEV